ncbi:hypothetical protein E4U15_007349, partial [Claviceps sp. LM218 group G6]
LSVLAGNLSTNISPTTASSQTRWMTSKSRKSQSSIRWKCQQAEVLQRAPPTWLRDAWSLVQRSSVFMSHIATVRTLLGLETGSLMRIGWLPQSRRLII